MVIESVVNKLKKDLGIVDYRLESNKSKIGGIEARKDVLKEQIKVHSLAVAAIQEVVNKVAQENLFKVERLVNSALSSVFTDKEIVFSIKSKVLRGMSSYYFSLICDGKERGIRAKGGGVWCVVAFVLKLLVNVLTKREGVICLDESLSFLSAKYISSVSDFIKELASEFKLSVLLVTHQELFKDTSDRVITASNVENKLVLN